jgi:ribosomal protein S18 acetylase RimI-like enzyme
MRSFGSDVRELVLEVKDGNTGAIRLYEELGFRRVGLVENYYTDGSSAVKMQLRIHGNSAS